jgi:hypothetical protein
MTDELTISPWSHPKAQEWFETIFERSGALLSLSDEVFRHGQEFDVPQIRMFASLLLILGREGVWPVAHRGDLTKLVDRLLELLKQKQKGPQQPMTVEAHRLNGQQLAEAEQELELLRRSVGLSRRINKLESPASWRGFWNA